MKQNKTTLIGTQMTPAQMQNMSGRFACIWVIIGLNLSKYGEYSIHLLHLRDGDPCSFLMAVWTMVAVRAQKRITNHQSHARYILSQHKCDTKSLETRLALERAWVNMKTSNLSVTYVDVHSKTAFVHVLRSIDSRPL